MKVLVLGARGFAKVHLESLRRLGAEIAVFDRKPEALKEAIDSFGAGTTFTDINCALSSDAEIVDIVLPHNMHRDIAIKAISRGKHVIIEKPISTTVAQGKEIIAAAKKAGRKLMVAEQYFFDPAVRWTVEAISQGKIGRVQTIVVRDQRLYQKDGWRARKSTMGGGALIDGGIHYVDTMLNFGGDYTGIKSYVYHGISTLEGEDTSMALFRFGNGAHGLLLYTWSYPHSPLLPSFEVVGTEGSIVEDARSHPKADFKYMKGTRYAFGHPLLNGKLVKTKRYDVFDREIGEFIRSVEEGVDVPMDPSIALRDLGGVLAIYKAGSAAR